LEPDGVIPLGTFIEFTWHPRGPEMEDKWDFCPHAEDAQLIGIVGEEPVPSSVILSDAAWEPRDNLND
jgi:hypothetical protein